jgi:hypothetical protein
MRKTLLIAAAALAGSVISSQAGVYSQNIVGYANIPAVSGKNTLITCPFTVGVSNGINEIFGTTLPLYSTILTYNGVGYNTYLFDNTDPNGTGLGAAAPVWYAGDDTTVISPLPTLPPGLGFFLVPGGNVTNTFAGAVAINVGTSNQMTLASGKNALVACVVPYAGAVTNGSNSGGGPNLNGLPLYSTILFYNGIGYNTALYDNTDPNGVGATAPNWYQGDDTTPYVDPSTGGNVPTIAVGQGFFVVPGGAYTWTVGL